MTSHIKASTAEVTAHCAKAITQAAEILGPERLDVVTRACVAVRKAADAMYGDKAMLSCLAMSKALTKLLREEGYEAGSLVGIAGWRVGPNDSDCITHDEHGALIPGGVNGHAWVSMLIDGDKVIFVDPSTAYLKAKADALDAHDSEKTTIAWAPEQLIFTGFGVHPDAAGMAEAPGTYAYLPLGRDNPLAELLRKSDPEGELFIMAGVAFTNPDVHIVAIPFEDSETQGSAP